MIQYLNLIKVFFISVLELLDFIILKHIIFNNFTKINYYLWLKI